MKNTQQIDTVFLNHMEEAFDSKPIEINYPIIPMMGDRISFDGIENENVLSYMEKANTHCFIVLSRHLNVKSEYDNAGTLIFVKPFYELH